MARKVYKDEPLDLINNDWLGGDQYFYSENLTTDINGNLILSDGYNKGIRISNGLNLNSINNVENSLIEWERGGHDVIIENAVSESEYVGSMYFDGVDDVLLSSTLGNLGSSLWGIIDVQFYAKLTQGGTIAGSVNDGNTTFLTINTVSTNLRMFLRNNQNQMLSINGAGAPIDNQWHKYRLVLNVPSRTGYLEIDDNIVSSTVEGNPVNDFSNFQYGFMVGARNLRGDVAGHVAGNVYDFFVRVGSTNYLRIVGDDPPGSTTARDISGNNNHGTIYGASYSPDSPLWIPCTNNNPFSNINRGDNLKNKYLHVIQKLGKVVENEEPNNLNNGEWLNGNEYYNDGLIDNSGSLELNTGITDGVRVSESYDLDLINNVINSKMEWDSTGDVEVLTAVSETSAQGSLYFDGVDDHVEVQNFPKIKEKTIYCKFKSRDISKDFARVVQRSDNDSYGFRIMLASGFVEFWDVFYGSTSTRADSIISENQWYEAICISDGEGLYQLYINGVLQTSTRTVSPSGSGSDLLWFGYVVGGEGPDTQKLDGNISTILIYDRVLSSLELDDIRNNVFISDGLIGGWPLDDTNSTARDISGNNNNGTIIGATFSPDNPLLQVATNGQPIPGLNPGDNLQNKKLYLQQRLSRNVDTDPSPTLTNINVNINEYTYLSKLYYEVENKQLAHLFRKRNKILY